MKCLNYNLFNNKLEFIYHKSTNINNNFDTEIGRTNPFYYNCINKSHVTYYKINNTLCYVYLKLNSIFNALIFNSFKDKYCK